MGEDAAESDDDEDGGAAAAAAVDWRAYSQSHALTDKQQRLAQKIRKHENRIAALQTELDKIRVGVCWPAAASDGAV
jgi:hypothetical protein